MLFYKKSRHNYTPGFFAQTQAAPNSEVSPLIFSPACRTGYMPRAEFSFAIKILHTTYTKNLTEARCDAIISLVVYGM